MKPKILIIETIHECIIPMLEETGYEEVYQPNLDRATILSLLPGYMGVIVRSKTPQNKEFIDAGTDLKFIAWRTRNEMPIAQPVHSVGIAKIDK